MHISKDVDNPTTTAIVKSRTTPTTIIDARSILDKSRTFSSWPSPAREIASTLDSTVGNTVREHPLGSKTAVSLLVAIAIAATAICTAISVDAAMAEENITSEIAASVSANIAD